MYNDKSLIGMLFDGKIINGPYGTPHNPMDNQIGQDHHDPQLHVLIRASAEDDNGEAHEEHRHARQTRKAPAKVQPPGPWRLPVSELPDGS